MVNDISATVRRATRECPPPSPPPPSLGYGCVDVVYPVNFEALIEELRLPQQDRQTAGHREKTRHTILAFR